MFGKDISKEELDRLKEEHESVLLSLNNSKNLLAEKETELKQKQSEIDDLVLKADEEKAAFLTTKANIESEKSSLEEGISELRIEINNKQTELADLLKQFETEKQSYEDFVTKIATDKSVRQSEFDAELTSLKQSVASLKKLKSDLDSETENKKKILDEVVDKIIQKDEQFDSIQSQVDTITQRIEEDTALSLQRVTEAENKVTALTTEVSDLKDQSAQLVSEITNLQKAKKIAEEELAKILEENKTESANAEQLKKRHLHVVQKEEYLRDKYELIGETYPEFKI